MLCLSTHSLAGCGRPANQDSGCHYHPTAFWAASWFDFDNLCYQTSSFFPGSFQASGGIAPYCLHFCLLQASHWHHCHLQVSHCRWWASQELLALRACLLLGCNTAGCGMAAPGIGRNSSSQSSRDSHLMWSSNTHSPSLEQGTYQPVSVSSIHHWFLHHTGRPVRPAWLAATKQASKNCNMRTSTKAEANTTEFELKWLQMHIFNFAKKTISMICTPNFTFFISSQKLFYLSNHMLFYLSNHRNYSIYLITKISLSI